MFAKVLRLVAKWYGNPTSDEVFPQIFEDALYAWKTGEFAGVRVFQAEDPGGDVTAASATAVDEDVADGADQEDSQSELSEESHNAGSADCGSTCRGLEESNLWRRRLCLRKRIARENRVRSIQGHFDDFVDHILCPCQYPQYEARTV